MIGRYIKCLTDEHNWAKDIKTGDYLEIKSTTETCYRVSSLYTCSIINRSFAYARVDGIEFELMPEGFNPKEKGELEVGGYVKVTELGSHDEVNYEVGEIWKVESLSSVGTMLFSGIFVINNAGTRCQFGLSECEYIGMHLDEINKHFYSLNNSQKTTKNGRTDTTNGCLRPVPPQVGQREGRFESRVQSRKGQVKLAECDLVNQGSVSYGKTKGGGLKGRVPFRLPGNS